MQARVVVRQDGNVLAEVPLEMRVVKQTLTVFMAVLTFLLPLVAAVLQHFGIDLRSRLEDGLYSRLAGLLLGSLSPDLLALLLLGITLGLYLWLRPRKRDVFWDIIAVGPQEQADLARKAFAKGDEAKGRALLRDVLVEQPQTQAAWLLAADRLYQQRSFREALTLYRKAFAMGTASAAAYMRASLAAGQVGKNAQALAILKEAVAWLPEAQVSGAMWYNLGCFAARLGLLKEAVGYLNRAVAAGYVKLAKFRTDPDLAPLRRRGDFKTLLACLDA
jgi:tetratricopeptide (TPR) repeat protein